MRQKRRQIFPYMRIRALSHPIRNREAVSARAERIPTPFNPVRSLYGCLQDWMQLQKMCLEMRFAAQAIS